MAVITAQDVNKLRTMTGAGMMDCKKALTEADGDFEKAIEILRKKGQKVSASRSDKEAKEGSVFIKVSDDKKALLQEKVGGLTLAEKINELVGKIGEKLEVSEFVRMKGETVVAYIHAGSKLGVLVSLKGVNGKDVTEAGKDVGMQIAAMNPVAVDETAVDKSVIEKELEIAKAQILAEGKPANMVEKIAAGKLQKFFKDNTL